MLIDASGQPCTWGKASREYFYGREGSLNAPLAGAVLLCVFKTAAYITGEKKWEDEYRLAALEKPYQYADIMTQYWERYTVLIDECLSKEMDFASEALKESDLFFRNPASIQPKLLRRRDGHALLLSAVSNGTG